MNTLLVIDDDASVYVDALREKNLGELEIFSACDSESAKHYIDQATIILGRPALVAPLLVSAGKLRWLQSTFAGIEQLCDEARRRDYILTGVKDIFGQLMSEYIFGYILAQERSLFKTRQNQRNKAWSPIPYKGLETSTIGIIGLGSIGKSIAATANHFKMRVIGMKRTQAPVEHVEKLYLPAEKSTFLPLVDYLVVTLPATELTIEFLKLSDFKQMKSSSILMSVGRGSTINQEDLITALSKNYIGGAVLDVFEQEPLPPTNPLWSMDNVIITPHNSAFSFPKQIVELFCMNYELFLTGKKLKYTVNFKDGY